MKINPYLLLSLLFLNFSCTIISRWVPQEVPLYTQTCNQILYHQSRIHLAFLLLVNGGKCNLWVDPSLLIMSLLCPKLCAIFALAIQPALVSLAFPGSLSQNLQWSQTFLCLQVHGMLFPTWLCGSFPYLFQNLTLPLCCQDFPDVTVATTSPRSTAFPILHFYVLWDKKVTICPSLAVFWHYF